MSMRNVRMVPAQTPRPAGMMLLRCAAMNRADGHDARLEAGEAPRRDDGLSWAGRHGDGEESGVGVSCAARAPHRLAAQSTPHAHCD